MALSIELFEELRRTIAGGSLLCLPELPLIERFEYTWDRTDGVEQISVQRFSIFALHDLSLIHI